MSFIQTSINSQGTFKDFMKAIKDFFLNNNCCKFELEEDIKNDDNAVAFTVCKNNLKIEFSKNLSDTYRRSILYKISFKENKQNYSGTFDYISNNDSSIETEAFRTMNIFLNYSLEDQIISFSLFGYSNNSIWSLDNGSASYLYFEKMKLFFQTYWYNQRVQPLKGVDLEQEMSIFLSSLLRYNNKDASKIIFLNKVSCVESQQNAFLYFLDPLVSIDKDDTPGRIYRINEENYLIIQSRIALPIGEKIEYTLIS